MKNHSLTVNNGLSLSQAQSISNLCNQRATEIDNIINNVNNISKVVEIEGKLHLIQKARPMPENVVELLQEKARLHACQAFLMENMKAKNNLLIDNKIASVDTSHIVYPVRPDINEPEYIDEVDESYGWEQLSPKELAEYWEAEAFAAHIGQYIHKRSVLGTLRSELPNIPDIEWMEINNGVKTPVMINAHHNSEDLLALHEKLAAIHRTYEQKVNYYKAKVKNLTTEKNSDISKENATLQAKADAENNEIKLKYNEKLSAYNQEIEKIRNDFEIQRHAKTKVIASMRINVDQRFQPVIDDFLNKLGDETK